MFETNLHVQPSVVFDDQTRLSILHLVFVSFEVACWIGAMRLQCIALVYYCLSFFVQSYTRSYGQPRTAHYVTHYRDFHRFQIGVLHPSPSIRILAAGEIQASAPSSVKSANPLAWNRNLMFRWITGLSLGAIATVWIASGNGPFSLGFLLTSLIAQNEYYAMVRATGTIPAYKTGTIASLMCYVTAAMCPSYHELIMPISATILMLWLLVFNKKSASINEISTSLLGMFYLGYLPSFWVRLRALNGPVAKSVIARHSPVLGWAALSTEGWTLGALVTWWTWFSIVTAGKPIVLNVFSVMN